MSYQQPIIKMLFNEAGSKVSLDLNAEISLQTLDLHGKTSRIDTHCCSSEVLRTAILHPVNLTLTDCPT